MSTKMIEPHPLDELASAQAADVRALQKIARKLTERLEEVARPHWSPAGRQVERGKALAEAQTAAKGVEARMRARTDEAAATLTRWDPGARRLAASLAEPVNAAALRDRIARVPVNDLRALAVDAKSRGDWLMADAIAGRVAEFGDNEAFVPLAKEILAPLDAMDGGRRGQVQLAATAIGEGYVQARIYGGVIEGKPVTSQQLVEISFEHGTGTRTPAGVL